jgi:hypothetical protein
MNAHYHAIKHLIMPGDIIAFSGKGFVPWVIKFRTNSCVSHVGIMFDRATLMEATTLEKGKEGVFLSNLETRISEYDGDIWWLSLDLEARSRFDLNKMQKALLSHNNKEYDTWQAIASATIWWTKENMKKLFCSELCACGLESCGVLRDVNCSEMTPKDIVNLPIYQHCIQLSGEPKSIYG